MEINIVSKGDEKEEYADTIPREDDPPAERLSEHGLRKVAFEPRNPESHALQSAGISSSESFPLRMQEMCRKHGITKVVPR